MLAKGDVAGDVGADLLNYLGDNVTSDSKTVWSGLIKGGDGFYGVYIECYHGIYYIFAADYGHVGYFLTCDDAESYVYSNWAGMVDS